MALSIAELAQDYRETIEQLLAQQTEALQPTVKEHAELITRATFLLRNQSVTFTEYNTHTISLTAMIRDVSPIYVQIFLANKTTSCTCLQSTCRHRVATLFALYQHFSSVQRFVDDWRTPIATERSPAVWRKLAYNQVHAGLQEERSFEGYNLHYAKNRILQNVLRTRPFEREWQALYELFMEMHVMYDIWQMLEETPQRSFHLTRPAFQTLLDDWQANCLTLLESVNQAPRLFATDEFIASIIICARKFISDFSTHTASRLAIYEAVIRFIAPHSFTQEQKQFDHPTTQALTALYTNEGELDAQTLDMDTAMYLLALDATKATAHAEALVDAILPRLPDFIEGLPLFSREERALAIYDLMLTVTLSEEQEAQLFLAFGTAGLRPYSHFLIRKKRYDDWVGLHILHTSSLAYATACGFNDLVKVSPQHALPIYHYYAMQEIEGKSRVHYKNAVRILRAMRTAAKRAGEQNYFNDYINTLQHQHKRLRALQEELEKGSLTL